MDENRKSWHPATTKATNARAKSTCTLQCTPLKCKAAASVAASSPSADADMEKAAICSSVQQREINSATLLLTTVQEVFTLVCKQEFFPILHPYSDYELDDAGSKKKTSNDQTMTCSGIDDNGARRWTRC